MSRSSIQEGDRWEQLMVLRAMTETTGVLHEAQILQLRYWPLAAFPHVSSVTIAYDTGRNHDGEDSGKRVMEFRVKVDPKKRAPKNIKKRFEVLDQSVKDLLGPTWTVRVKAGNKKLFESAGRIVKVKDESARGQARSDRTT